MYGGFFIQWGSKREQHCSQLIPMGLKNFLNRLSKLNCSIADGLKQKSGKHNQQFSQTFGKSDSNEKIPNGSDFWSPKNTLNFPWMHRIITLPLPAGAPQSKYGYFDVLYNPVYMSDSILRGLSEAYITSQLNYLHLFHFHLVGNFE